MTASIEKYFEVMWQVYVTMTPQAQKIVNLLEEKGETVVNDHIALRTLEGAKLGIDEIAKPFLAAGYKEKDDYHFEQKKLYAKHYEHSNELLPKVFISELKLASFSTEFQQILKRIESEISNSVLEGEYFLTSGKNWQLSSSEYEILRKESEYGSWLAAIGFRPNHFTISINHLKHFSDVGVLNSFIKESGFALNNSGGEIKGDPSQYLEQSSTLADNIDVQLSDKTLSIPSCYFEFAKRYPMSNGKLYQGFVASSADKIFESTDNK